MRRFIRFLLLLGGDRNGIAIARHGINIGLFDERQHTEGPTAGVGFSEAAVGIARPAPAPAGGGKKALLGEMLLAAEGELADVVAAVKAAARFTGRLHRRYHERHE